MRPGEQEPEQQHSLLADRRVVLALLVAGTFFMENLDGTVIAPAIPAMAHTFAVAPIDLNVGVSAYMMTLGVFVPLSGWAAERFGERHVFAIAVALFTLASLLCGLVTTLPAFVATRILQGVGGALMVPVGRLAVLRTTPKERLIAAIAVLTWPALVAPVLGPPLGGLIVDYGDWRWIFWLNLPLGLIAFLLALRLVPTTSSTTDRRFDWPGFLLTGGAIVCLMFTAEVLARPDGGWTKAGLAFVFGVILMGIGVRHLKHAAQPMFDLDSLGIPTFAVTIWGGTFFRVGVSAVPFLIPTMFQIGFGFSSLKAGVMLMAVFAGNLLMKPLTTSVLRRFGFRSVLVLNGLINALAIAACAAFTAATPLVIIAVALGIGGMSRSMQFTTLNTIAFADVPERGLASANTLFSTAFQLAMGLGVALGAIAWRIGDVIFPAPSDHALPFRVAFLVIGAVSAITVLDGLKLAPEAGDHVTRKVAIPGKRT